MGQRLSAYRLLGVDGFDAAIKTNLLDDLGTFEAAEAGSPQRLPAVAAHGASADLEAKGTQLADDADGAPPRMLSGDADDQLSQLCGNPGSSGAATTLPAPVGAPSRTMPAHHRVRLDHHERASPSGPTTRQQ